MSIQTIYANVLSIPIIYIPFAYLNKVNIKSHSVPREILFILNACFDCLTAAFVKLMLSHNMQELCTIAFFNKQSRYLMKIVA